MRKLLLSSLLFSCMWLISADTQAAIIPETKNPVAVFSMFDRLASLNMKQAQQLMGRKFTLKEKMGFLVFKQQVRRAHKKGFENTALYRQMQRAGKKADGPGSKGLTALVFGIAAIALLIGAFFVGFLIFPSIISAILAIIVGTIAKHQNPGDVNGKIGKLLGWISLGITAILVIAVAVAIANIF